MPNSVKVVQCFLGFANFYRLFIRDYSSIAAPLIALTKKGKPFQWTMKANDAFLTLKKAFTSAPILVHADPSKAFVVEEDGSDFALGAILSQEGPNGSLHAVAFYLRKFTATEINYEIYDKELMAIVVAFEQWRKFFYSSAHKIKVYTDHRNLLYYTTTRKLNRRRARWSMFLAEFEFEINFRPGIRQGKPDALSRRPEYTLKEGEDAVTQQIAVVLKPRMLSLNAALCYPAPHDASLTTLIRKGQKNDERVSQIKK